MAIDRDPKNSKVRDGSRGIIWNTGEGASWGVPSASSATLYPLVEGEATSGTDTTPVGTNEYTIPEGHNGLAVWVGTRPIDEFYVILTVKVGSASDRTYHVHRHQQIIINAAAGETVSFASQVRLKGSVTGSNLAVPLTVAPINTPTTLTAPSSVTGTVNCDRNGPVESGTPTWTPAAANAHVVLGGDNQTIQINSTSTWRAIFVVEHDNSDNASPIRTVIVPANEIVRIQCRYKKVSFANFAGATISVTCPAGATIGGASAVWRPSFTATSSTTVTTVAEFKTALNGGVHDDIIVASGTYDLSLSGSDHMNSTNYSSAMNRDLRIRSATGNPADVTFSGSQGWNVVIPLGKRWVLEGITIDITGDSAGALFTGRVDGYFVNIIGTPSGTTNPSLGIIGSTTYGAMVNTWAWGSISDASEDTVDLIQTSGQTAGQTVGRLLGYTLNGNGPSANSAQVLTAHFGSSVEVYGCSFTDTGLTANSLIVATDNSSFAYMHYCETLSANVANTVGMSITANGVFCCNFEAVQRFIVGTTGSNTSGAYLIGTIGNQRSTSALGIVYGDKTDVVPYVAGCTLTTITTSGSHGIDCRCSFEVTGNQVTMSGTTTSSIAVRVNTGTPASGSVVRLRNNRFRCATSGARMIEIATSANISLNMVNNIFDQNAGTYLIGATGTTDNVAENNYFGTGLFPTNFTTRFTSVGSITSNVDAASNYWSSGTAPGLESNGVPSVGGLSDTEGKDPGISGSIDRFFRSLWLGGEFVRGPLERTAIKTGAQLFPETW